MTSANMVKVGISITMAGLVANIMRSDISLIESLLVTLLGNLWIIAGLIKKD